MRRFASALPAIAAEFDTRRMANFPRNSATVGVTFAESTNLVRRPAAYIYLRNESGS